MGIAVPTFLSEMRMLSLLLYNHTTKQRINQERFVKNYSYKKNHKALDKLAIDNYNIVRLVGTNHYDAMLASANAAIVAR